MNTHVGPPLACPAEPGEARADAGRVAELQSLYGSYTFSETLLQKIWLKGDFDRTGTVLQDGRRIIVRHAGAWNRLGGPDFRGARFHIEGEREQEADVELHLEAVDWVAHRHAIDPAYFGVGLHVVLFPPPSGHVTCDRSGFPIPVLALLPWLQHDLEEYAADDAIESLARRPLADTFAPLAALPQAELSALLRHHARERWDQKVRFAGLRIARLGWESACHHTALEVLGFRFNRTAMLRTAARFPLSRWTDPARAAIAHAAESAWALQGSRPANRPLARLSQYNTWVQRTPNWPEVLLTCGGPTAAIDKNILRKVGFLPPTAPRGLNSCRTATLACDALLPLLSAQTNQDLFQAWHDWPPGDAPPVLKKAAQALTPRPLTNGKIQSLLGWLLSQSTEGGTETVRTL